MKKTKTAIAAAMLVLIPSTIIFAKQPPTGASCCVLGNNSNGYGNVIDYKPSALISLEIESFQFLDQLEEIKTPISSYKIFSFSNFYQNIWQPPKIS